MQDRIAGDSIQGDPIRRLQHKISELEKRIAKLETMLK
jgi:hypothetical protein